MKLRHMVTLVSLSLIFVSSNISAQDRGFGIGFIVAEPTGLSAKFWTTPKNAFDFGLGFSVGGDRIDYRGNYDGGSRTHFHMDYLWHSFNAVNTAQRFPVYYGIGGRFNSGGGYDASLGVRGVFGVEWFPRDTPLDVFVEVVPVFQITPEAGFGIDAGLGLRFFFQ